MTRIRKVPEQTEYPWKPELESMSVPVPAAIYCNYRAIYSVLGKKASVMVVITAVWRIRMQVHQPTHDLIKIPPKSSPSGLWEHLICEVTHDIMCTVMAMCQNNLLHGSTHSGPQPLHASKSNLSLCLWPWRLVVSLCYSIFYVLNLFKCNQINYTNQYIYCNNITNRFLIYIHISGCSVLSSFTVLLCCC